MTPINRGESHMNQAVSFFGSVPNMGTRHEDTPRPLSETFGRIRYLAPTPKFSKYRFIMNGYRQPDPEMFIAKCAKGPSKPLVGLATPTEHNGI